MKPYFAKYLPVPGEIKEGDIYWNPRRKQYYIAEKNDNFETLNTDYRPKNEKAYQKVKLFLCSRDIQVGDEVVYEAHFDFGEQLVTNIEDDGVVALNEGSKTHAHNLLKVIGEISPEATWVKQDDEFDEDDIFPVYGLPEDNYPKIVRIKHSDGEWY